MPVLLMWFNHSGQMWVSNRLKREPAAVKQPQTSIHYIGVLITAVAVVLMLIFRRFAR